MDGGCLTNQGVHHLDLVRYLVGEPASVLGLSATFGSTIEVEDSYIGMCKFLQSKCLGTIEVTTAARPRDFCAEISILGSSGMAQIGGIAVNELQIFTPDETECSRYSEDFSDCVYGNGHKDLYREISDDLHSRSSTNSYSIDIEDALGTLAFLDACYRSSENYAWAEVRAVEESVNLGRPDSALTDFYKLT